MTTFGAAIAVITIGIGTIGLILKKNLIMKLLSLSIINTSTILFFIMAVYRPGDRAPIGQLELTRMADPLPQALTLTAVVINFGVLALSLLFTMVLVKRYHTLDIDKIEASVKREYNEEET